MCWTPLYANKQNNVIKTCVLLQTTGGKDEPNIIFMRNHNTELKTLIFITATGFLNWCFVIVAFSPNYNNKHGI